jgi:hypothetical protein
MKRLIIYLSLPVGLLLITMPLYAQGLFPGVEYRDMKTWAFTFVISAMFMVLWYMVKRWITLVDRLNDSVGLLSHETKLHRVESTQFGVDINILKRRMNKFNDWCNKHNIIHAKCPHCPDIPNDTKNDEAA